MGFSTTVFEPLAQSSLERYIQKDIGSDFLASLTDHQYLNPQQFIDETRSFGSISKRFPFLPKGFKVGISRIFLTFFWLRDENRGMPNEIFSYFIADGVDLIVPADLDELEQYRMYASIPEFMLIPENMAATEPERATGRREAGQIFATSRTDSERLYNDLHSNPSLASSAEAGLAVLTKPIKYNGEYFPTVKNFDPSQYGLPFGLVAPSRDSILKKASQRNGF